MAKIGRNDACPCGSGKKSKKCCLVAEGAPPPSVAEAIAPAQTGPVCLSCGKHEDDASDDEIDEINDRADHILDELLGGRLDVAEVLCHDFLEDFPRDAEGHDLLSMICEKRGNTDRALELLRRASAIAHARSDYDAETRRHMRERIKELEVRA
jgi:hypothetical protein